MMPGRLAQLACLTSLAVALIAGIVNERVSTLGRLLWVLAGCLLLCAGGVLVTNYGGAADYWPRTMRESARNSAGPDRLAVRAMGCVMLLIAIVLIAAALS